MVSGVRAGREVVDFRSTAVLILDQRALPGKKVILRCTNVEHVAQAIETLAVRGAPAIGVAGAFGVALAATRSKAKQSAAYRAEIGRAIDRLSITRPTARNLFWVLGELRTLLTSMSDVSVSETRERVLSTVHRLVEYEAEANRLIGAHGAACVPSVAKVMTLCNTGPLATASYGTALGVVIEAVRLGKKVDVYACETRPLLQGARLTAWELVRERIPVTVIADSAAASVMRDKKIDLVVVGADRIAANGDTANKIGTFALACAAHHLAVPFYIAAPSTTFDLSIADGHNIPIEYRSENEVHVIGKTRFTPKRASALNPAFDVTPAGLISGIMTDRGVLRPPFEETIRREMGTR